MERLDPLTLALEDLARAALVTSLERGAQRTRQATGGSLDLTRVLEAHRLDGAARTTPTGIRNLTTDDLAKLELTALDETLRPLDERRDGPRDGPPDPIIQGWRGLADAPAGLDELGRAEAHSGEVDGHGHALFGTRSAVPAAASVSRAVSALACAR